MYFSMAFSPAALFAETSVQVSAALLNFNYEEFDQEDQSLNKETGNIPGVSIALQQASENFSNSFSLERYGGTVNYDGATQTGTPHTTRTDETLTRLSYKLNWSPAEYEASIFGRLAWQQWDRNILPNNGVFGLFEQYRWWAVEIGANATLYQKESNRLQFELAASKITQGTIEIDLNSQGFGRPVLDLGDGSGFTTALLFRHELSKLDYIGFDLRYQYWKFGRSNTQTISNGTITIDITEPRSISKHGLISLNYVRYF